MEGKSHRYEDAAGGQGHHEPEAYGLAPVGIEQVTAHAAWHGKSQTEEQQRKPHLRGGEREFLFHHGGPQGKGHVDEGTHQEIDEHHTPEVEGTQGTMHLGKGLTGGVQ